MFHGGIVDQIPALEIVGGIEHEGDIGHEGFDVPWCDVGDEPLDVHRRIDPTQLRYGGFGLREPRRHVVFVEKDLPLKIV